MEVSTFQTDQTMYSHKGDEFTVYTVLEAFDYKPDGEYLSAFRLSSQFRLMKRFDWLSPRISRLVIAKFFAPGSR